MRFDAIGLVNILLGRNILFFNYEVFNYQNNLSLLLFNYTSKLVFLLFKFNSFFKSTFLLDSSTIKTIKIRRKKHDLLFFNFFNYLFNLKINLFVLMSLQSFLESIVKFFKNNFFTERENVEMHGIDIKDILDVRYLLLDYLFYGFPLLKYFPLSGYVELFYNYFKSIILYIFLSMSSQLFRFLVFDF